jgi:hypothetical protein
MGKKTNDQIVNHYNNPQNEVNKLLEIFENQDITAWGNGDWSKIIFNVTLGVDEWGDYITRVVLEDAEISFNFKNGKFQGIANFKQ